MSTIYGNNEFVYDVDQAELNYKCPVCQAANQLEGVTTLINETQVLDHQQTCTNCETELRVILQLADVEGDGVLMVSGALLIEVE